MIHKVYVVDDDELTCVALRDMLEIVPGIDVELFESGTQFLDAMPVAGGLLLMDVYMPGLDGFETIAKLETKRSLFPTIMMSGKGEIRQAVQAIKMGAVDYLEKPCQPQALYAAVKAGLDQLKAVLNDQSASADAQQRIAGLSERESELLRLLVSGMTNKDAAEQMGISVRTAEAHRAKLMLKLGADNFTDVMRLAYASGFVTLNPDNGVSPALQQA
ncbi:response regulator [Sphingobium sp. AS12]|uniref:response regulator transcription factor n=1 Tax=Sphingobium sp. AS12 TaxID=2849495 RepID=UPI001C31A560|nr:response regulator [Sphingobium sp. AS12]